MQMLANIFRIYPVETLPSMKTHSIVLFKRLRPGGEGEEGGGGACVWQDRGENGAGVSGHTRLSIY